jgi:subtilisin family serine protease
MRFKHTRTFAAVAMVLSATVATNTGAVRPEAIADGAALFTPAMTPIGLDKRAINVMVQLGDDPVALKQEAAGRKLSKAEKDAAKNALRGPQDALRSQIEALGGTVVATYQSSYNGIKVRITRDKAAQLATLPGVVAVRQLQLMKPSNTNGVPLISAPSVWQNLGLHGENIKIAVIDTGIDYTHANFGGPGTVAAYNAEFAANTKAANPAWFGPSAPRVKGGIDLVGDDYNADPDAANYQPIPHPDPNPLDCVHTSASSGHGSHVAGSAAGSGVLANGKTYTGAYNATTISGNSWTVGPGVAPKADIYSVRVFGCSGSTDVTVDAIEWAVDNDMDVINMSLGSSFGTNDDPSAVATTNAAKAGVVVVTSAGNSGPSQYITGSPALRTARSRRLRTIRCSSSPEFSSTRRPQRNAALASGDQCQRRHHRAADQRKARHPPGQSRDHGRHSGIHRIGGRVPWLPSLRVHFQRGRSRRRQIAVSKRGTCARVAKAIFAQQAGAAVAVMTNNAAGLPPFEGPITANPDTGVPFTVTIPFAGVAGNAATAGTDSNKLRASPAGTTASLSVQNFANPNFTGFASFSSGGPRSGDSALKPDITGPGVSIVSTASGSGNGAKVLSGTSMASPMVAGVAALTRQAHPTWKVDDIKAAIVNTGLPSGVTGWRMSRGGTGLVQPVGSTKSQVVASADDKKFTPAINFGFEEMHDDFSKKKKVKLHNNGSTDATFTIAPANQAGSPHTVNLNKTVVTVKAGKDADVDVTLNVAAATAGGTGAFREVAGVITFTPATATDNGGVALRVPYYLVPRARADINTKLDKLEGANPSATAEVTNKKGVIPGDADFYAWGLEGKNEPGKLSNDIRAVGVQSFPGATSTATVVVFAVNTMNRWSNASVNEFDIGVDVDGDGVDDYVVVGADQGAIQTGTFNGVMGSFVFSTRSAGATIAFLASAPTDGSTALLPVRASQLCRTGEPCLSSANPRITYNAVGFDLTGEVGPDVVPGTAKFNVWNNAITTGGFATVAPGATDSTNVVEVNSAEWAQTPALGVMVVTTDNKSGKDEAQLIKVDSKKIL